VFDVHPRLRWIRARPHRTARPPSSFAGQSRLVALSNGRSRRCKISGAIIRSASPRVPFARRLFAGGPWRAGSRKCEGDRRDRTGSSARAVSPNGGALVDALELDPVERETFTRTAEAARGRTPRQTTPEGSAPANGLPNPLTPFIDRPKVGDIVALLEKTDSSRSPVPVALERRERRSKPQGDVDASSAAWPLSTCRRFKIVTSLSARSLWRSTCDSGTAPIRSLHSSMRSRQNAPDLDNCVASGGGSGSHRRGASEELCVDFGTGDEPRAVGPLE
jgi:hypothetical protein